MCVHGHAPGEDTRGRSNRNYLDYTQNLHAFPGIFFIYTAPSTVGFRWQCNGQAEGVQSSNAARELARGCVIAVTVVLYDAVKCYTLCCVDIFGSVYVETDI